MNKIRILALASALATTAPFTGTAPAAATAQGQAQSGTAFTDEQSIAPSMLDAVRRTAELGIMGGYGGAFRPDTALSRQELASILVRTLQISTSDTSKGYVDVAKENWSYAAIAAVTQAGIMTGDGKGHFRPRGIITREESAALLVRASGVELVPSSDSLTLPKDWYSVAEWAKPYVRTALAKGFISLSEDGSFSPKAGVERQEMAFMLNKTFFSEGTMGSLQSIDAHKVRVNGVLFDVSGSAEQMLGAVNRDTLKNAELSFTLKGRTITEIRNLRVKSSGTAPVEGNAEFTGNRILDGQGSMISGNLELRGDYLSMRNLTVSGDLIIGSELLHDFKGSNITVLGNTIVSGGDSDTVVFENSQLAGVDVNKPNVHVESTGSTTIGSIAVNTNATITSGASVAIPKLVLGNGAESVTLNGEIGSVTLTGTGSRSLSGNATIELLTVQNSGAVSLLGTGTVQTLKVESTSSQVTVGSGVTVKNTVLAAGAAAPTISAAPVVNTAPKAVNPIGNQIITLGSSIEIDIGNVFKDDEQTDLKLNAVSASSATVRAVLNGTKLTLTPQKAGTNITILLSADDRAGKTASSSFRVTVNTPPASTSAVADQTLILGSAPKTITLKEWFSDADSDSLVYEALFDNPSVATAELSGGVLTLTALKAGTASLALTVSDGRGGSLQRSITVNVNRNPAASGLEDRQLTVGGPAVTQALTDMFHDDDLDPLTFTAESSDPAVVTAAVYGDTLEMTPLLHGSAVITLTARDDRGGLQNASFKVNVNTTPAAGSISNIYLRPNGQPAVIRLEDYFSDADGDALTYTIQSSRPDVAAAVYGDALTVTPGVHGDSTITIIGDDGFGGSVSSRFDVTVNEQPQAIQGMLTDKLLLQAGPNGEVDLTKAFGDADGDPLTFTAVSSNPGAVAAEVTGGMLTLRPLSPGASTITVTANDGYEHSEAAVFSVTVNAAPVLSGSLIDQLLQEHGQPAVIDLSGIFSDQDGDALTFTLSPLTAADLQIAETSLSGSVLTLTPHERGEISFTITAKDGKGGTVSHTLKASVNAAPELAGTLADQIVQENAQPIVIDLSAAFSDRDGDALTFTAQSSAPASASVLVNGNTLTIDPKAHGTAVITVTAADPRGGTLQVPFTVNVNANPVKVDGKLADRTMLPTDQATAINLNDAFSDPDGDTLTFTVDSADSTVVKAEISSGTLKLTPLDHGLSLITVTAQDGRGGEQTASFKVSVNTKPEAASLPELRLSPSGQPKVITLADYFSDADGDVLEYTVQSDLPGVAAAVYDGGKLTVTPGAHGTTTITITGKDGYGEQATTSFDVVVNDRPEAIQHALTDLLLQESDAGKELDLAHAFEDTDGDALSFTAVSSNPDKVAVSVSGGRLTVDPKSPGTATITVQANDGYEDSGTTSFTVTVNAAPVLSGSLSDQQLQQDGQSAVIDLSAKFTDADGDALTYTLSPLTAADLQIAAASLSGTALTLTPNGRGEISITVTARDSKGGSLSHTLKVSVNAGPESAGTLTDLTLQENTAPQVIDLSTAFSDPDGDTLTFTALSSAPGKVAVTLNGNSLSIEPKAHGSAVITVTANDPRGGSIQVPFTVSVNSAPVAAEQLEDRTMYIVDPVATVNLSDVFTDADGDVISYTAVSDNTGVLTASASGGTLTLTAIAEGTANVTVTAADARGGTVTVSFKVTVTQKLNHAPEVTAAIGTQIMTPGVTPARSFDLSQLFSDADGDALTYTAVVDPTAGTATVSGSSLTLEPAANTSRSADVTVTATDSSGKSVVYKFTLVTAQLVPGGLVTMATKTGVNTLSYNLSSQFPGQTSFKVYYGTQYSTFTGPDTLNGTVWNGQAVPGYVWIVGADGRAVVLSISVTPQGEPKAFFSEYLDAGNGRVAIEIIHKDNGNPNFMPSGYSLDFYQYVKATGTTRVVNLPMLPFYVNMTYNVINSNFYDFFDITTAAYYNEEFMIYLPDSFNTTAIVLKKDGQIVDVLGDMTSQKQFLADGGTIVRKSGIYTGSSQFSLNGEWDIYPKGSLMFYGRHTW